MNSFGIAKVVRPEGLPNKYMTRYRDMIMSQVDMYTYVPRPGALGIVNQTLSPAIKFTIEKEDSQDSIDKSAYAKMIEEASHSANRRTNQPTLSNQP